MTIIVSVNCIAVLDFLPTLEMKTPSSVASKGFPAWPFAPPRMLMPSFSPGCFWITTSCNNTGTVCQCAAAFGILYPACCCWGSYLHPRWWWVPSYQHMDLLLIGQKSAYSFLVCGMAQVDGIHFQYSVSNTESTLACKTMRNHLMVR